MNTHRRNRSSRRNRNPVTAAMCALLMFAGSLGVAGSAFAQDDLDMEALKEAIKQEILEEIRGESGKDASSDGEFYRLKEEIKREILLEIRKELSKPEKAAPDPPKSPSPALGIRREPLGKIEAQQPRLPKLKLEIPQRDSVRVVTEKVGHAEGQILRRGTGLAGCKVKLTKLSGTTSKFSGYKEEENFETVTGPDGRYQFDNLPVGIYKLKWQLPGDKGWIRRLWDKPDATIRTGQVDKLKSVETARKIVSN